MNDSHNDALGASPAEQASQIRSLQQQLRAVQHEHDHYRDHYRELESVCWKLMEDVNSIRQEGLNASQARISLVGESPGSRRDDTRPSQRETCSPALIQTPARASAAPCLDSPICTLMPSNRSRVRGALHMEQPEAQALVDRLSTLQQWMQDLTTSLPTHHTRSANVGAEVRNASRSFSSQHHLDPAADSAAVNSAVRDRAAQQKCSAEKSPRAAFRSPRRSRDAVAQLQAVVDELFLRFTQLQATLTDLLWTTAHPPALSTPAHTRQDRDVEVARLRAINQQLRRTLRGYEQTGVPARNCDAHVRVAATLTQKPLAAHHQGPAGYAPASENGLFVAFPRKR